jgi:hypothetical protein
MLVEIDYLLEHPEILVLVIADISIRPLGLQKAIAFFPYPERMALYTSYFGQVTYAVYSHVYQMMALV